MNNECKTYYKDDESGKKIYVLSVLKLVYGIINILTALVFKNFILSISNEINVNGAITYIGASSVLLIITLELSKWIVNVEIGIRKTYTINIRKLIHAMSEEKRVVTNIDKFLSQENVVMSRKEKCPCDMIERNLINVINAKGEVYPCLGQYAIEQAQPLGSLYQLTYENIVKKSNLDYMAEQYIANGCRFCKNSTTRKELDNYFTTKIEKHVRDFHVDFL